jgi:hypothetical protein
VSNGETSCDTIIRLSEYNIYRNTFHKKERLDEIFQIRIIKSKLTISVIMARKLTGNPPGPVPKPINWEQFQELCSLHCTQSEIASFLKIDEDTLRRRVVSHYREEYAVIYKRYLEEGNCSIRREQRALAKTNASLSIWLGKQWLGQRDHEEVSTAPKQEDVDLKAKFYESEYKRLQLQKELDDLKSQANTELQRIDTSV